MNVSNSLAYMSIPTLIFYTIVYFIAKNMGKKGSKNSKPLVGFFISWVLSAIPIYLVGYSSFDKTSAIICVPVIISIIVILSLRSRTDNEKK